jgi:hypothetical protein
LALTEQVLIGSAKYYLSGKFNTLQTSLPLSLTGEGVSNNALGETQYFSQHGRSRENVGQ